MSNTSISYRSDIDGLRAIAVLSVLLFHIDSHALPGGFTGVDIFFVISGYLISSIVYSASRAGNFSLSDFYIRRMRRIQPVLWVVIVFTFVFGVFILLPSDLKFLADSIRSTLTFTSNFFFANKTDYFNPVSAEYPLLHTWSLAVEEQFYVVWPMFLLLLCRYIKNGKVILGIIFLILLASLIGTEWAFQNKLNIKYIYFLLPSRVSELGLGAWLGILHLESDKAREFKSHVLSVVGLAFIVFGFFYLNEGMPFPGISSLIPCLGAVFLIGSGPQAIVNQWLATRPMVYIGGISYSLYLWHFPVIAYFLYMQIYTSTNILLSIFLIFVLSIWSKRTIEDRYRRAEMSFKQGIWSFWLKPGLIILMVVVITYDTNGLPQRYFLSSGAIARDVAPFYETYCHQKIVGDCVVGDTKESPQILLYGDSHAGHYIPFWDLVGQKKSFALVARTATSCFAVFKYPTDNSICTDVRTWFNQNFRNYKTIILGERWELLFGDDNLDPDKAARLEVFNETLQILTNNGIRVIVLAQVPKFRDREYEIALREKYLGLGINAKEMQLKNQPRLDSSIDIVNSRLKEFIQQYPGVVYFDPIRLVPEFLNHLPFRSSGMAYKDGNHLNEDGAKELADLFLRGNHSLPL